MASLDLKQIDYSLVVRRARPISLRVGTQGPRGSGGITEEQVKALIAAAIAEAGGVTAPVLTTITASSIITAKTIIKGAQ